MAKGKAKAGDARAAASAAAVASVLAEVEREYGAGIVMSGREVLDDPPRVIPMSPAVDEVTKGVPEGSWVALAGPPKCGKGQTALSFAAECQKPENGSRPVMVLSVEHRLSVRDLEDVDGLKVDPPHLYRVESTEGRLLTSVDFLDIGSKFLKSCRGGVLVIDSVSALVNPAVMTAPLDQKDRGAGNQVVARFCDLCGPVVKANKNVVVGVVQLYANTGGVGTWLLEKMPTRFKHQADVWMLCKKNEPWKAGSAEDAPEVGMVVHWQVKNSPLGGKGAVESYLRYGAGIDKVYELFLLAAANGFVSGSGHYTFEFLSGRDDLLAGTRFEGKPRVQVQGKERALQTLREHPAWVAALTGKCSVFLTREGLRAG
jgi:RecA/RadA recombinase